MTLLPCPKAKTDKKSGQGGTMIVAIYAGKSTEQTEGT